MCREWQEGRKGFLFVMQCAPCISLPWNFPTVHAHGQHRSLRPHSVHTKLLVTFGSELWSGISFTSCTVMWLPYRCPKEGHQCGVCILKYLYYNFLRIIFTKTWLLKCYWAIIWTVRTFPSFSFSFLPFSFWTLISSPMSILNKFSGLPGNQRKKTSKRKVQIVSPKNPW